MSSGEKERLLRHIITFGVTTDEAARRQYGEEGVGLLKLLLTEERIQNVGAVKAGDSVYTLHPNECLKRGLPLHYPADFTKRPQALLQSYLVLAFCVLGDVERRIMRPQVLAESHPDFRSRGRHCIEGGATKRIWRIFTPLSPRADMQTARHISQAYQESQRRPRDSAFRELVTGGH